MLRIGDRCACSVPDGVLFGSSTAHKAIRKEMDELYDAITSIIWSFSIIEPSEMYTKFIKTINKILAETKKFDSSLKDAITYIPCERIDDVLSVAIVRN